MQQHTLNTQIVDLVVKHLTDFHISESFKMLYTAPSESYFLPMAEEVIKQMDALPYPYIYSLNSVSSGPKEVKYVDPVPGSFIGKECNLLLIEDVDLMSPDFVKWVDDVLRCYMVVVSTNKDIESKQPSSDFATICNAPFINHRCVLPVGHSNGYHVYYGNDGKEYQFVNPQTPQT